MTKTQWTETELSKARRELLSALKPFKPRSSVTENQGAVTAEWFGDEATWAEDHLYAIKDVALESGWEFVKQMNHPKYFAVMFKHSAAAKSSTYYPNKNPTDPHAYREKHQVQDY